MYNINKIWEYSPTLELTKTSLKFRIIRRVKSAKFNIDLRKKYKINKYEVWFLKCNTDFDADEPATNEVHWIYMDAFHSKLMAKRFVEKYFANMKKGK